MEQPTKYWMWNKRKLSGRSHVQSITPSSFNDSWEEQAFAEDSAGPLGGCIWPPRSYSCSFCRREFRSAQALGGHMNVHRRDRARLKQSPTPLNENLQQQSPCTALGVQYPSQVCTLVYNNPNPITVASPISPSRVAAPSTQENCSKQTLVCPYDSSIAKEHKKGFFFSSHLSLSNSFPVRVRTLSDSNLERENLRPKDSGCGGKLDCVMADSDVGSLNFILQRSQSRSHSRSQSRSTDSDGDEDESISVKRRRVGGASLSLYTRPSSSDRLHLKTEVLGLGPSPVEELDLELRLGDRPKWTDSNHVDI